MRKMSLRGRSLRVAFSGNFVVHPEARSTPAGLRLLEHHLGGDQELTLTDTANEASRILLERMGSRTVAPLSVSWARPLRPALYAFHALDHVINSVFSAGLKFIAKPFCGIVDSAAARISSSSLRQTEPHLIGAELDVETHLKCLSDFRGDYSLWPEYDVHSLQSLLGLMEKVHPRSELRKIVLRDEHQRIVGWYLYFLEPGAVCQVVQIGGERKFTKDVLDHLFHDAWKHGAIALHGKIPSERMPDFWEKNCFFTCLHGWIIAHSRNAKVLDLVSRGDISLSRLDGDWCLGLEE